MRSGRLFWILGFAFAATACLGGQSGSEGQPDFPGGGHCAESIARPVALDDVTPEGVARTLLDRFRSPQLATLSWELQDGTSTRIDTTVTLSVSGEPETASFQVTDADCQPRLQVTGGTLRFETADGGFLESFPGVASRSATGDAFDATLPISQFAGSYDVARVGQPFRNAKLLLHTSFSPASGRLFLSGDNVQPGSTAGAALIATWTGAAHDGT